MPVCRKKRDCGYPKTKKAACNCYSKMLPIDVSS